MSYEAEPLISKNSWYLSIVGVLPEFQKQGLGTNLIQNVLEKTDNLEVPTYLETFTPGNMIFYVNLAKPF
jgi:GNAT superfamily N-acetyltransferase